MPAPTKVSKPVAATKTKTKVKEVELPSGDIVIEGEDNAN
jgi:hypothetical protein